MSSDRSGTQGIRVPAPTPLQKWAPASGFAWRALGLVGVAGVFVVAIVTLLGPLFQSLTTFGFHDWDSHSAYRFATVASIKRYHELPWWNPWLAGGFPAWAYVEGATNLISPYFLFYMTLPVQVAERVEVVGATLTGLVSAYLLAGRVTRSVAVRALVAVVYAVNGRWALQVAVGHSWHMQYAWLPLVLFFYDISLDPTRRRYAFAAGLALALIVYMGGIYPLPHTALALVLYGGASAIVRRNLVPIETLVVTATSGIGFAAPKLLPMVDLMLRYPRKIDSSEAIDLGQLMTMLTEPHQSYAAAPIAVPRWGWHEYGIYVGLGVALAMALSFVFAHGPRAVPFKLAGLAFLLLGMGAFHADAPWTLLHQSPVFSSQHVPTRFLFPAVLMLMLVLASFAAGHLDRIISAHGWVDVLLLLPVCWVALDITSVGRLSTEHSFYMQAPVIQPNPEFHQDSALPFNYSPPDWAGATLLAEFGNIGLIGSYGLPAFEPGAIPIGAAGYRGEAYVVGPPGARARVAHFTSNTAILEYDHAGPGSLLVYNMNYDPSWRADGRPALDYKNAVAVPLSSESGKVRLSYYPRTLNWGLLVCALTFVVGFGPPMRRIYFTKFNKSRTWARARARAPFLSRPS